MNGKTPPHHQNCAPAWGITMVLIFFPLFWFYLLVALAPPVFVSFIN